MEKSYTIQELMILKENRSSSIYRYYDFVNEMKSDKKNILQKYFLKALEETDSKLNQSQIMKIVKDMFEEEIENLNDKIDELEESVDADKIKKLETEVLELEVKSNFDANDAGNILIDLMEAKKIKFKNFKKTDQYGGAYPFYYIGNENDTKDPGEVKQKEKVLSERKPRVTRVKKVGELADEKKPTKKSVKKPSGTVRKPRTKKPKDKK